MRIPRYLFFTGMILCLASPVSAQSPGNKSVASAKGISPVSSTYTAPVRNTSDQSSAPKGYTTAKGSQSADPVQGRIVYVNSITREIYVVDENNVKRPVRLSLFQFSRVKIGETVNVAGENLSILSRAPSRTGGLVVSRRYVGSRLLERWD